MSKTRTDYSYSADVVATRQFAAAAPMVRVVLTETIATVTQHDDRSTTTHETRPRIVASWPYKPEEPTE